MTVALALLVPLPYFIVGLAAVVATGTPVRYRWLAPLVGVVICGWAAEVSTTVGFHPAAAVFVVWCTTAFAVQFAFQRWRSKARLLLAPLGVFYLVHFAAVAAVLVCPYPGVVRWTGDYAEYFVMTLGLVQGQTHPDLVARPPLFTASGAPWFVLGVPTLAKFQLVSAAASAAGVVALLHAGTRWPTCRGMRLAPLLATPFFLLHVVTGWSKLLAAGAVIAALVEASRARRTDSGRDGAAGAFLFASAIAVHHSSILFLPLLIAVRGAWRWKDVFSLAVAVAVLVLPWELWTLSRHGSEAKLKNYPPLFRRATAAPLATFGENLLCIISGWPKAADWDPATRQFPGWGHRHSQAAYFFVWQAGTLVGCLAAFVTVTPFAAARRWIAAHPWTSAAGAFVVVANAAASPFPDPGGMAQTGSAAIQVLLLLPLLRRSNATTASLLAANVVLFAALHLAALVAFVGDGRAALRKDASQSLSVRIVERNQWTSAAVSGWPLSAALGSLGLMVVAAAAFRPGRSRSV
jgi:hypothetical protein